MGKHKTKILKLASRGLTVGLAVLMLGAPVLADQYDDQISNLQKQAQAAQANANTYAAQANDYQSKVNQLNAQINAIQSQINLNQAKYNKLTAQIDANKAQLARDKDLLDQNIREIYQNGQISTLEMLVSSDGLADFLDRQQALQSIKDKISDTVASIKDLQAKLEKDQKDTQAILAEQQAENQQVASQEGQVSGLLALAQNSADAANQQVRSANSQISSLRAAQAASFARLHFSGSNNSSGSDGSLEFRNLSFGGSCGGGYPGSLCGAETDSLIDQWQLYNRECVSYAAWAMEYRFGHTVNGFHGQGNAYQWPYSAPQYSGASTDSNPTVGSVAIVPQSMIGGVGHAMVVESILSGGWIHVSQYNWWPSANGPYGLYSTMDVKTNGLIFVHFH